MHSYDKKGVFIEVGARASPLSKVQVKEVHEALQKVHPHIHFNVHYFSTTGDLDQATSLRDLEKSDFFTKEIDIWVLEKAGRIGIHSAKDLPAPLAAGLSLFCLTKGLDPSDSLVLREGETLATLPSGALVATSSARREEAVQMLRSDISFCDLRGTIEQRLTKLDSREADGVVVAEAALIRLGLTHLNRVKLPGATVEGQGRLAIVGRKEDRSLRAIFTSLDYSPNND